MRSELSKIFSSGLLGCISRYLNDLSLQEIRIKINKPCILIFGNKEVVLDYIVSKEEIKFILQRISNYSLYAYEEDIRQGFITIQGGHRVGIAGECVMENGRVKTIRNITSLNIRICSEVIGCSNKVIDYLVGRDKIKNTLIISPPKCGKTTLLRDIAREISERGFKITIVDERSEIAASYEGIPQMKIGIRADVLDNCLKSVGMMMAIRSLSHDVLICDEIGTLSDVEALIAAFNSGVSIITTIHGYKINDFLNRKVFSEIIENNILERVIVLSNRNGVGTIEGIYKLSIGEEKHWLNIY